MADEVKLKLDQFKAQFDKKYIPAIKDKIDDIKGKVGMQTSRQRAKSAAPDLDEDSDIEFKKEFRKTMGARKASKGKRRNRDPNAVGESMEGSADGDPDEWEE